VLRPEKKVKLRNAQKKKKKAGPINQGEGEVSTAQGDYTHSKKNSGVAAARSAKETKRNERRLMGEQGTGQQPNQKKKKSSRQEKK